MRFDLPDLRLFLLIVDAGSITQGAALANLALASASQRLSNMEESAGVKLLERHARGVVPTEAGESLAHRARLMMRQSALMKDELGDFANGEKATIQLFANSAALNEFLPERLATWMAEHPHVNVDLKERSSRETVAAISAGLAELGIVSDAVNQGDLKMKPFALDRLVLVVPESHPLAGKRQISFGALLGEQFVAMNEGSALQEHIDEQARRAGQKLRIRVRMRTFRSICGMVAGGVGVGIVPESAAKRYRRSMAFKSIKLSDGWAARQLSICYQDWKALSPSARELVEHLVHSA